MIQYVKNLINFNVESQTTASGTWRAPGCCVPTEIDGGYLYEPRIRPAHAHRRIRTFHKPREIVNIPTTTARNLHQ